MTPRPTRGRPFSRTEQPDGGVTFSVIAMPKILSKAHLLPSSSIRLHSCEGETFDVEAPPPTQRFGIEGLCARHQSEGGNVSLSKDSGIAKVVRSRENAPFELRGGATFVIENSSLVFAQVN